MANRKTTYKKDGHSWTPMTGTVVKWGYGSSIQAASQDGKQYTFSQFDKPVTLPVGTKISFDGTILRNDGVRCAVAINVKKQKTINAKPSKFKEPTNKSRAKTAAHALQIFGLETGLTGGNYKESKETIVGDFLCNLLHYCGQNGIDFQEVLKQGRWHYEAEIEEEA